MRYLLSCIITVSLLFPFTQSEAATTYQSGKKGGCYTVKKSKNTGKTYKKYVDAKFCKNKK